MCECSVWQFPVSCACVSCACAVLWFENISGVTPAYLCMMTFLHGPFAAVGRHWVLALLGAAKSAGGARERATERVRRFEATLGRFGMPALLASGRDVGESCVMHVVGVSIITGAVLPEAHAWSLFLKSADPLHR